MAKLTDKQQRFVKEYLVDLNATQAAIRAGYSKKTADQQASRLLTNVKVAEAVAKGAALIAERTELTQDRVVRGLLKEAEATGEGTSHGARVSAWGILAKHLGMMIERHEHTGPGGEALSFKVILVKPNKK